MMPVRMNNVPTTREEWTVMTPKAIKAMQGNSNNTFPI